MNNCLSKTLYNCIKFGTIIIEHFRTTYKYFAPFIDPTLTYLLNEKNISNNNNIISSLQQYNKSCSIFTGTSSDTNFIIVRNNDQQIIHNNNYQVCDFTLTSLNLIINNRNTYDINLTEKINFYIVDNIIDLEFIKWYVFFYYDTVIRDSDNLSLSILNDKYEMSTINIKTNSISFKKETYEII